MLTGRKTRAKCFRPVFTNKPSRGGCWASRRCGFGVGEENHRRTFGPHEDYFFLETKAENNRQNQQQHNSSVEGTFPSWWGMDSRGCDRAQYPGRVSSGALLQIVVLSHLGWKFPSLLPVKATGETRPHNLGPVDSGGRLAMIFGSFADFSSTLGPSSTAGDQIQRGVSSLI